MKKTIKQNQIVITPYYKIVCFFISFFIALQQPVFSQKTLVDSLIKQTKRADLQDSIRVKHYCDICWELMSNDVENAMLYARKELALSKKINSKKDEAQALSDIGNVLNVSSNYDSAIVYYNAALHIRESLKDKIKAAGILTNIAAALTRQSKYKDALTINFKTLKLFEQINDTNKQAIVLSNIGHIYYDLGQNSNALTFYNKALNLAKVVNDEVLQSNLFLQFGSIQLDDALLNKNTLVNKNKLDSAFEYFKKSETIAEKNEIDFNIAAISNEFGRIYGEYKNYDKAIFYFNKSLKIKMEINDFFGIGVSNMGLGNIYALKANYVLSENYYLKAATNFIETKSYVNLMLTYGALSEISEANKDYTDAIKYSKLYIKYNDSVYKSENAKQISELQTQYETEKKETENKLLQQENSLNQIKIDARNKTIIGLLISVALIVLLIAWRLNVIKLKKKLAEIETEKKLQYDRERISRDLHDNVGGQLSYVMFSLEGNEDLSKEKQMEKSHHLANALRGVTGNLRETIWALNKEELTVQDISDKLKLYTRNMFAYNNIKLKFNDAIENDTPLNPAFALNIFRICQEIINNVFKHAQATELIINITKNKNVQITITDNGIGFASKANDRYSFGLTNLQTRANEINATLNIKSEINKGTSITLVV